MARFNEQDSDFYRPTERRKEDVEFDLNVYRNLDDYPETKAHFEKEVEPSERNEVSFYAWYNGIEPSYGMEEAEAKLGKGEDTFLVEDGKVKKSWYTANPDAKYDYYCVIGEDSFARFQGSTLVMKDGSHASRGRVGDIDIEATVNEAVNEKLARYRKVHEAVGNLGHKTWPEFLKRVEDKEITIDEARTIYHAQEDVKRFAEWARSQNNPFMDADEYACTEDKFVENETIPVFCANILGEWVEQAEMGWWGMTSNEKSKADWKSLLERTLRKAQEEHPDEEFHFLDCHI